MEELGTWQWWPQPASSMLLLLSSWQQSINQINGLIAPLLVTKLILLSALNKCQAAGSWPGPRKRNTVSGAGSGTARPWGCNPACTRAVCPWEHRVALPGVSARGAGEVAGVA